jgi:hypothetical protein
MGFLLLLVGACAIDRSRGDSGRTQCQNNLKQVVLAIHDYASTYQNLLPALSGAPRPDASMKVYPQSILFAVLPFIEEDNIYKTGMLPSSGRLIADNGTGGGGLMPPGTTPPVYSTAKELVFDTWAQSTAWGPIYQNAFVKTYVCPTDSSNSTSRTVGPTGWVGSSYAANVTVFGGSIRQDPTHRDGGGAFTIYDSIYNVGNIPDGTSNTIGFAERFAYTTDRDGTASQACLWAYPPSQNLTISGSGNSVLNGPVFGITAAAQVPAMASGGVYGSTVPDTLAPDPYSASLVHPAPTGTYLLPEIGQVPPRSVNAAFGAVASQHIAVVQVAMMDGSARGVTTAVSQLTWNRAVQANDGSPLGSDW